MRYANRLKSLTLVEPPAFRIAAGDPVVDEYVAMSERVWTERSDDASEFLRRFLQCVGSSVPPGEFSPALLQGARTLAVERYPWAAEPPLDELAATPFPKLVISGAHNAAFDAVCDVLEQRLGARRAVLPGAGHSVPRLGEPFNELLAAFIEQNR